MKGITQIEARREGEETTAGAGDSMPAPGIMGR